jgi:hypothetical protein
VLEMILPSILAVECTLTRSHFTRTFLTDKKYVSSLFFAFLFSHHSSFVSVCVFMQLVVQAQSSETVELFCHGPNGVNHVVSETFLSLLRLYYPGWIGQ